MILETAVDRFVTFLDELEWYARALKHARERDQDRERSGWSDPGP